MSSQTRIPHVIILSNFRSNWYQNKASRYMIYSRFVSDIFPVISFKEYNRTSKFFRTCEGNYINYPNTA